jgi:hypothetical protein
MRRTPVVAALAVVTAALAVAAAAMLPAGTALAAPSPAAATAGKTVCQITDANLSNMTGLVATATGYAVVRTESQSVYLLDGKCKRKTTLKYNGTALSPQDISVTKDGTLWVADTGDADAKNPRPRIALWKVPANGAKGTIYRFTYPDGAHLDSHAMVLSGNGTPIFITKVTNGPAGLYAPVAALNPTGTPVALKKVGEFTPQRTGTSNPLGALGSSIVTGGAVSPDGTKVVLRTYSDAYQWPVTNGDVAAAITGGKPLVTPLPDEAGGEAISFTRDGQFYLTATSGAVSTAHPEAVRRYTPRVAGTTTPAGGSASAPATGKGDTRNWWDKVSLEQIAYLVAAIGVIGLVMVIGGVVGIRRSRRLRRRQALAQRPGGRAVVPVPVPGPPPRNWSYDSHEGENQYRGEDPYRADDQYGASYDPYDDQPGSGYPPQEYRSTTGYHDDYDQPGPRQPGGGTYQGGGYGPPQPRTYGSAQGGGGNRGTGRAAPPRQPPPDRGYPDDPGVYGTGRR